MKNITPPWLLEAKRNQGIKEIQGKQHNPEILSWIKNLGGWFNDDETPWCGTFVAHCLQMAGKPYPTHWYRAKAYADFGTRLTTPIYGCIAVFERQGGGHVGFVYGEDSDGNLLILGGNQANQVNIRSFQRSRVVAYVWPDENVPPAKPLPLLVKATMSQEKEEA